MIVFTPIKIPNNLTLIIYIIRSQASRQAATEEEGNIQISFVFTKYFSLRLGGKPNWAISTEVMLLILNQ